MTSKEIKSLIKSKLKEMNYHRTVQVVFHKDQKVLKLTEPEIRALQHEVATIFDTKGLEAAKEFTKLFTIYSYWGDDPDGYEMHWREDLPFMFDEVFDKGFYDVCARLTMDIIRISRKH